MVPCTSGEQPDRGDSDWLPNDRRHRILRFLLIADDRGFFGDMKELNHFIGDHDEAGM